MTIQAPTVSPWPDAARQIVDPGGAVGANRHNRPVRWSRSLAIRLTDGSSANTRSQSASACSIVPIDANTGGSAP